VTEIKPADFYVNSSNACDIKINFPLKPTSNLRAFSPTKVMVVLQTAAVAADKFHYLTSWDEGLMRRFS
jgi:hypothetical protein